MEKKQYFHFTIGPVQSFVAQARRTRDFWAGSFLLSWLAGVAMVSVRKQAGENNIAFPTVDENYLTWIETGKGSGEPPRQGGIPNRFKAEVDAHFKPELVVKNVEKAWKELADLVWNEDLAKQIKPEKKVVVKEIWERQIEHFWEMSWVLTPDKAASDLLDRRKNWRNYFASEEPGIKCMMMVGWQELSGELKPNSKEIEKFWKPIHAKIGLDLREGEHLCAIAFVKRRFARHFKKLNKPKIEDKRSWNSIQHFVAPRFRQSNDKETGWARGWELKTGIPSISYMAALHWLETIIKKEETEKLDSLLEAAKKAKIGESEKLSNIDCLNQACEKFNVDKKLIALDGSAFFISELENKNLYEEKLSAPMITALKNLDTKPPSPFYAILMMDGDSLGSKMSTPENQKPISKALENFTSSVPKIVAQQCGFLVYAGGDDVLAILPLERVFTCAIQIRESYQACFQATKNKDIAKSTISAAVEFAHIKMPLTKILRDAHRLLDNVAKEGCGRDAIAVRVWKPGGMAIKWAMPWECALNEKRDNLILADIATQFRQHDETETGFSNKFFYKIREQFELLNPAKDGIKILEESQQCTLLATDYVAAGNNRKIDLETAKQEVAALLEQCRRYKRDAEQPKETWKEPSGRIDVDGALLVRFLVGKGVEKNG
ncbi:type III-B CRISPR-associated protein Cas10/Cmr2 [Candidatus Parabeggiatoa sp. HSG14]|uniref:type III-B CRISPR-associated protein Cas10/Cmr2 n=1 Tax=Candidatus Parabeggiatoa sp. HSG14 TaxID=3055593 RepID=UPI0025A73994|nr:type III-B CRISPR-associated protein Cas10/Cmr2 [Thiotrichales bacterium HSG14]